MDADIIDIWPDYPHEDYGDNTALIVYMRCRVPSITDYTALTHGTNNLSSAALAGVKSLPAGYIIPGARWCLDNSFSVGRGKTVEFTREFRTVPATHDRYDGSVADLPKGYADGTNDVLKRGGPKPVPTRFEHQYATSIGALVLSDAFQVTYLGLEVDWVRNSPATSPTLDDFYGSSPVGEDTLIRRWRGDIYEAITPYLQL